MKRNGLFAAVVCALAFMLAATSVGLAQPVVIEYWHVNTDAFGGPAVRELVRLFNERNPDIRVEERFHHNFYTGLTQNLQAALAARRPPAVAQIGYNYVDYVSQYFSAVPLDEIAPADELQTLYEQYPEAVLKLGQSGGKQWGLPYALSSPVLYYNPELFAAAGLDPERPPATWEEVVEYSRQIKERTGKYGVHPQLVDNWLTQAMMESAGGRMLSEDGKRVTFNEPEAVRGIAFWKSLIDEGIAPRAFDDDVFPSFTAGNIGMVLTTIARRSTFEREANFPLRVAQFPAFEGIEKRLPAGGNVLMVFTRDRRQQAAAWEFLKWLLSPEAITIWVKGTGYVSPIKGLETDPRYLGDLLEEFPTMKAAYDQVPSTVRWVNYPGPRGLQVEQILLDARNAILIGGADPQATLDEAARRANELIR